MKMLQMPNRNVAVAEGQKDAGLLPQVWATEGAHALAPMPIPIRAEASNDADAAERERATPSFRVVLAPGTAFYRSYTEAMLRRYGVLSLESGRVPSLLGREMFRGKVTSYRVHAFDDVVIFVHDVERCIGTLSPEQQRLILRIGVQEYTFQEAASMLRMSLRSAERKYFEAVDELTSVFLKRKLLERVCGKSCQEGDDATEMVSHTP